MFKLVLYSVTNRTKVSYSSFLSTQRKLASLSSTISSCSLPCVIQHSPPQQIPIYIQQSSYRYPKCFIFYSSVIVLFFCFLYTTAVQLKCISGESREEVRIGLSVVSIIKYSSISVFESKCGIR